MLDVEIIIAINEIKKLGYNVTEIHKSEMCLISVNNNNFSFWCYRKINDDFPILERLKEIINNHNFNLMCSN